VRLQARPDLLQQPIADLMAEREIQSALQVGQRDRHSQQSEQQGSTHGG
jgi:hypothetical protein